MVPGVFEGGDCCRWEKKMKILLVDTSGPVCGVAIAADGDLVYEAFMKNKMTHSQKVMPMVKDALMRSDLGLSDLDAFAAVVFSRPNSRQIGAAMSSKIIAMVYGSSFLVREASFPGCPEILRIRKIVTIPRPAPI